jgi:hypothetical protein
VTSGASTNPSWWSAFPGSACRRAPVLLQAFAGKDIETAGTGYEHHGIDITIG